MKNFANHTELQLMFLLCTFETMYKKLKISIEETRKIKLISKQQQPKNF